MAVAPAAHAVRLGVALCLVSCAARGQVPCSELDLLADGFIGPTDFAQGLIPCVATNNPDCDYDGDGDGDSDGADLAFFLANFPGCRTGSLANDTDTALPVLETTNRLLAVEISDAADLAAGDREFEIRFRLPSPDAEVISVAAASLGCGSPPCFTDPGNSFSNALSAGQYTALGLTADTYVTIGDRSGDVSPVPLFITLDQPLFVAGQEIRAGVLGWYLSPLDAIGTPGSPGLGSADGNIDNTVVLVGVAQLAPALAGTFDVAYTHGGELFLNRSSITVSLCAADTNGDGQLTPADFNAWVAAFNAQAPACDQNGDTLCTPADFNAWVANFNAGCP